MPKNIYTTADGKLLNVDQMRLLNEKVIAVGNMGVNARGDQVNSNGDIIKTRNEVMKERRSTSTFIKASPKNQKVTVTDMESEVEQPSQPAQQPLPPSTVENTQPSNLRGSLASAVGVDLTNAVTAPKKTITRL